MGAPARQRRTMGASLMTLAPYLHRRAFERLPRVSLGLSTPATE